ncbi:tetratricopeptide repeat protein, partial [Rhizobium sp. CRIBSB]|nr:tetratricopeptide repeat protein [Rhizobium sp. CRIBSB]
LKEAAATGLSTAAVQAGIDGAHEFAAVYLRLALLLDPADELKLRLGQTLAEAELEEAARAALADVGTADPMLYAAARTDMALSFERQGRSEEALPELRRAYAAAPTNTGVVYLLAAQLTQMDQYDEALTLLNGPVLNAAGQGFEIHFLRGAAYESRGDIALAEAELWAAHQMKPDDATVLNYLGYLWVDKGLRVEQGADMIARAFAADPENGNIQDSLGWAQYRQGKYDEAVVSLEAAVEKEPANAEINDHLGDAYWQVGRTREARFQWSRVLTLEPDAERRTEAERKLSEGLATAVPVSDGAQP